LTASAVKVDNSFTLDRGVDSELRDASNLVLLPLQLQAQGVIYALTDNGDLMWYRHGGRGDGSFTWAFNEGKKVGVGWDGFSTVFSG
jgi:hypothetical protein